MVVTLGEAFLFPDRSSGIRNVSNNTYQGISGFPAKTSSGEFVDYRFLKRNALRASDSDRNFLYQVANPFCAWLLHCTKYGERLYLIGVSSRLRNTPESPG